MDDFTPYGDNFDEALENLEKVLKRCEQTHLSLSTKKCHMMMSEGVFLGHFISAAGSGRCSQDKGNFKYPYP